MENIKLLDSNDSEELYEVTITTGDMDGDTISVLVIDGIEYFNNDWQGMQPKTLAECADYIWYDEDTYAHIL